MIVVGKQLRPSEMSIIPVQRLVALHSKNQEIWFVSKKNAGPFSCSRKI